jgi:type II secretory pathway component GspD/PulD (secretin)
LIAKLDRLAAAGQLQTVADLQIVALEGHQARLRTSEEEWSLRSGSGSDFQKAQGGTILTMTPHLGAGDEITLQTSMELSDSISRDAGSDLPIVTRRQTKNQITILNGGTVAIAGLNGGLYPQSRAPAKEVAIFITAAILPETAPAAPSGPGLGQ